MTSLRIVAAVVLTVSLRAGAVSMTWDGATSLHTIDFKPENFLDINSYQFRPSEEIRWYDVENGWRVTGGSLETNHSYLLTDLRLKRAIMPNFNARLRWNDEEFYAPREPERPLLELELQPALPLQEISEQKSQLISPSIRWNGLVLPSPFSIETKGL